ncbi:hypothetical protein DB35_00905 [Streptomyces abyssalis]|uniref:DUF2470 domain-containing protein n=1 Tax=Streptomyces abyssalis TaxID=933944 RepID=A0A1E7JVN2_9ACTN|nr:DUF2470 domain-containing protein [Streptomyces abyssalis]OEU94520.1 hypothetical protein AN215_00855 [Streptomyces abyssalis]OEU95903.1 hypothetical protein DB35_00905 [Streptomyces abyssalis]OEV27645.1 hypothetical protein AN219_22355 [Streptomyces nanshensis]
MRPFRARVTQPTHAERVRSILVAAHSMTVVSDGLHTEVHRLHETGATGHVHLHAPPESAPAGSERRVPVRLELTDIAPTPVRDRLRAQVTLTGLLAAPYDEGATASTCMEFGQALLEDSRGRTFVTLEELQSAAPDPLATCEAGLLTHLLDGHREFVPLLLRLVRPQPNRGVLRAVPVALDRYGVTLRLEYSGTHCDARLPFASPVTHPDQVDSRFQALLAAARRASHPNCLLT